MNNKLKNNSLQGSKTIQEPCPLILDYATIASLFFDDEGINQLIASGMIHIPTAKTKSGQNADLIIGLKEFDEDTFELRCVITTGIGTEYLDVYDDMHFQDSFNLKRWIHICTCDKERKTMLINDFPDNYEFNSDLCLA